MYLDYKGVENNGNRK